MIPKPPFSCDLVPEQEIAEFERLKPRLDTLWDALSANGGSVEQCGWLKDRYGVSWQIVPAVLMKYLSGPDAAGAQRAMQAMLGMIKLDIEGLRRAYEGKAA